MGEKKKAEPKSARRNLRADRRYLQTFTQQMMGETVACYFTSEDRERIDDSQRNFEKIETDTPAAKDTLMELPEVHGNTVTSHCTEADFWGPRK